MQSDSTDEMQTVIDIAYIVGTVAFFALMIAYVRGCQRLGKASASDITPRAENQP